MPGRPPTDYNRESSATGWFVGIIVALALLAIGYLAFSSGARASDLNGITAGTYLLHKDGEPGCSAQAVKDDGRLLLLTANHCVVKKDGVYSVNSVTYDAIEFDKKVSETIFYVDVVKRDETTDMAVLRPVDKALSLATVDLATIAETKAALVKGADVLVAGFPASENSPIGDLVFTEGMYTGLSRSFVPLVKAPMYRTTAPVYYGNSGGGLYVQVDGTWKLVGITSQTDSEMRWENSLYVSRDSIDKAIRLTPKPATDK